ncbi:hypothetical protein WMY93_014444 [Mugilogobius chulae]|uniref:Uncharacterized protein n=1 Tax=Mugilogobius chulae TaxID=88201 RepID=A0AAW0P149_9GOBI
MSKSVQEYKGHYNEHLLLPVHVSEPEQLVLAALQHVMHAGISSMTGVGAARVFSPFRGCASAITRRKRVDSSRVVAPAIASLIVSSELPTVPLAHAGTSRSRAGLPADRRRMTRAPLPGPSRSVQPAQRPRGARGSKGEARSPTVGYFTREQLDYRVEHTSDTWVLCTLSQGYRIQFRRRPPVPGQVTWTVIHDPAKAQALSQEIVILLAKGAIVPVDPRQDPGGLLKWNADGSGVPLWPDASFLPKVVSTLGSTQPLQLARFEAGVSSNTLCPVRALEVYSRITTSIRRFDRLFVCYGGPRRGQALSEQRLALFPRVVSLLWE